MKHLMEWEVSFVELTLGNVQLVNYHCRDVYKLWRDCDIRRSHAHPGRSERMVFQLQLNGVSESPGWLSRSWGKSGAGGGIWQVQC